MNRILQATEFAARYHTAQRRKNAAASPYINHPIDVANLLANVGGVTEEDVLVAALLHDTIEDTAATPQELAELFGPRVRDMVLEVSDDKSLPKAERKQKQIEHVPHLSPGARLVKLGDKICNLNSVLHEPPQDWSTQRRREYAEWAAKVVDAGLRGINPVLEARFDKLHRQILCQ